VRHILHVFFESSPPGRRAQGGVVTGFQLTAFPGAEEIQHGPRTDDADAFVLADRQKMRIAGDANARRRTPCSSWPDIVKLMGRWQSKTMISQPPGIVKLRAHTPKLVPIMSCPWSDARPISWGSVDRIVLDFTIPIDGIRRERTVGGIRCHRRLGGLLNYYYRAA